MCYNQARREERIREIKDASTSNKSRENLLAYKEKQEAWVLCDKWINRFDKQSGFWCMFN